MEEKDVNKEALDFSDKITRQALDWCLKNTHYTEYQYAQMFKIVNKWGGKATYHMTPKQIKMYQFMELAIQMYFYAGMEETLKKKEEKKDE